MDDRAIKAQVRAADNAGSGSALAEASRVSSAAAARRPVGAATSLWIICG